MYVISWSVISFLNELQQIPLPTCIAIISTRLNGFNYWYLTLIILFNINHLFPHSEMVTSITIFTVIIPFNTTHWFTHN